MKDKRILIAILTGMAPTGGLTTTMMNYYRQMNRQGLQIDFVSYNDDIGQLKSELAACGSQYFCLGSRNNVPRYFFRFLKLCRKYDVVHINGNSATATIELLAARMAGAKVRIAHNHTTKTEHPIIHKLLLPLFRNSYTVGLACSKQAGDWLFGNGKFSVLKNAIDAEKYRFNEDYRKRFRDEFGISGNAFLIGHVGKYNTSKNHLKLLEVFYEYQNSHENAWLLCVGYGPLQQQLEEKIKELGIENKVILTGERTDIPELLSTMDVFVFTSRWEGFGLAVIEAQASGLPCLLSDRVPKDVYLSDHVESLALEQDTTVWSAKIDEMIITDRIGQCERNITSITEGGYNIKTETEKLRAIYENGR